MRYVAVALLVACGSARPAPPIANVDPRPAKPFAPEWEAFTPGASFALHGWDMTLTARVESVVKTPEKWTIVMGWSDRRNEHETIEITAERVTFVERHRIYPRLGVPEPGGEVRGASIPEDGGGVCYVFNDAPPPQECGNVCVGEFCVDPKRGLVGGYGVDWPGLDRFKR